MSFLALNFTFFAPSYHQIANGYVGNIENAYVGNIANAYVGNIAT